MNELPTLATERLILRIPTPGDADRIAAYHAGNRSHLAPWEPIRPDEYFTPGYWRRALESLEAEILNERSVPFVLLARSAPDGPVIGRCAITNIVRGPFQAAHLGFSLAEAAVGNGFMFEALSAVIAFAFDDLALHRLMANHLPENGRSGRLLLRLGFRVEGLAPEYLLIGGAWRDHVLTSLVNPGWRPR